MTELEKITTKFQLERLLGNIKWLEEYYDEKDEKNHDTYIYSQIQGSLRMIINSKSYQYLQQLIENGKL